MEQNKTKEQGRRSSKERERGATDEQEQVGKEHFCRPVSVWFVTPWPCPFSKENLRAGSQKSKQMPNQGVAKDVFDIGPAALPAGEDEGVFP